MTTEAIFWSSIAAIVVMSILGIIFAIMRKMIPQTVLCIGNIVCIMILTGVWTLNNIEQRSDTERELGWAFAALQEGTPNTDSREVIRLVSDEKALERMRYKIEAYTSNTILDSNLADEQKAHYFTRLSWMTISEVDHDKYVLLAGRYGAQDATQWKKMEIQE